ncbi:hypothetical protein D9M72_574850 [compost metagenome]
MPKPPAATASRLSDGRSREYSPAYVPLPDMQHPCPFRDARYGDAVTEAALQVHPATEPENRGNSESQGD